MIQFVKQETQWPGLYIVSLNQKMRKGKNIAYKQVAKLAKVVPITTGKEWLKRKSVSVNYGRTNALL